jgi:hypothetical protein
LKSDSFIHRRYSSGWTLASLRSVPVDLTPIVLRSCSTSSTQRFLGRPSSLYRASCPSVSS